MAPNGEMTQEKGRQPEREREKKARTMTQKQLADIYFRSGTGETQQLPAPTVIHVKEKKSFQFFPWFISLLALSISIFTLVSSKKFEIDIRILDNKPAIHNAEKALGSGVDRADVLIDKSAVNLNLLQAAQIPEVKEMFPTQFRFAGASVLNSSKDRTHLTLANSTLASLAYAWIEYEPPINLAAYRLFFEIRGMNGGEQVELIFKDKNGNSSLNWKSIKPFDGGLLTEWQPFSLDLEATPYFDAHQIQQMRIEVGSQRTGNPADAKVMIRNLQLWPQVKPTENDFSPQVKRDNHLQKSL